MDTKLVGRPMEILLIEDGLMDARATIDRHFPFGFRLEPIQARNVSYSNNLRLPRV